MKCPTSNVILSIVIYLYIHAYLIITPGEKNHAPNSQHKKGFFNTGSKQRIAKHKKTKYAETCKIFEKKYKMNSGVFMKKFDSGELDDRDDFFDWYAAKKGLDAWSKKLNVLSGISL
ncbi:MAG: hypothetical protein O8C67_00445 [Candidatus Methanoperedens sp.]|nr:hypothetical protein [Candidatus Methanoperedens sp.]